MRTEKPCSAIGRGRSNGLGPNGNRLATSVLAINKSILLSTIIEILADKIPAVNHINDIVQSLLRPTAGAIIFAASSSNIAYVNPILALIAGLFISGSVNAVKTLVIRPAVAVTTGGTANVPVSVAEDVTSATVSILSVIVPIIAVCVLVLIIVIVVIKLVRRKKKIGNKI